MAPGRRTAAARLGAPKRVKRASGGRRAAANSSGGPATATATGTGGRPLRTHRSGATNTSAEALLAFYVVERCDDGRRLCTALLPSPGRSGPAVGGPALIHATRQRRDVALRDSASAAANSAC